jgi:hypothetical protein
MASISRSSILNVVVIAILLAALPGAIWRVIQTGDPYLFTQRFFADLLARLSGPGRMRFILQPTVAILLGGRDGAKDAQAGLPPFLWALAFHGTHWRELLRSALASVRNLVAVAILLDVVSQFSHLPRNPPRRCVAARSGADCVALCFVPGVDESDRGATRRPGTGSSRQLTSSGPANVISLGGKGLCVA